MKEECYDYFESNNHDEEETAKETDITCNVNDIASSQNENSSDDDKQREEETVLQQEGTQSVETTEKPEEPMGFWEKFKNYIMG